MGMGVTPIPIGKNFFYCRYAFGCRLGYVHCAYSTITDITFALRVWEWELGNGN